MKSSYIASVESLSISSLARMKALELQKMNCEKTSHINVSETLCPDASNLSIGKRF